MLIDQNIPIDQYRSTLLQHITSEANPNSSRLILYLFVFFGYFFCILQISDTKISNWLLFLFTLLIGYLISLMAFLGHELHHGSITKNTLVRRIFGILSGTPILISPTFWTVWHNKLHHKHTQKPYKDPDMMPTLKTYKQNRFIRIIHTFYPRTDSIFTIPYFLCAFSAQAWTHQFYWRKKNDDYDSTVNKKVNADLFFQSAILIFLSFLFRQNLSLLFFGFVIPLMISNLILISFILTNHSLSEATYDDDPFKNSLSVTNYKFVNYMTLNFGYHTEHHIFPHINGKNLPKIKELILDHYPKDYKSLGHLKALILVLKTPKLYLNNKQLVNPKTGEMVNCL